MINDDPIATALNLTPLQKTLENLPSNGDPQAEVRTFVQSDYEFARESLRKLVSKGHKLLESSQSLAEQGQDPEQWSSTASIMKALIDAHKELMDLSVKHQKITDKKPENVVNNNNLFVGSTAELQKIMKSMKGDVS
jgi:hypothetical protein